MIPRPALTRTVVEGVAFWTDERLREAAGLLVAFSERHGGASAPPYDSLNLAAHVGDDPAAVDENRRILLDALGVGELRDRIVTAEQVHGETIGIVDEADAGRGAFAAREPLPLSSTDALLTATPDVPLMLLFADCVPVVLVAPGSSPMVSVVHAGWRGALSRLPGKAASTLAEAAGVEVNALLTYVGPHIGECCYDVTGERLSQFVNDFVTLTAARDRLDLAAAVSESLSDAGVPASNQCRLGVCTMDHTDAFYSYRAEKRTGRHAAVAAVLKTHR